MLFVVFGGVVGKGVVGAGIKIETIIAVGGGRVGSEGVVGTGGKVNTIHID
jgi:hypothetical protein